MSFQLNVPPSVVSRMAQGEEPEREGEGGEEDAQQSSNKREDWKKLKELEEARKAGTAPAMKDEEGKDINPHIPQYIMQAPWYFGATQPTLKHQRQQDDKLKEYSKGWYNKGVKDTVATKFRKGACENCGAITHKKKDCLERPRKVGAKFTGSDFAPDEYIQPDLDFDFDGKRDRWNGYDTSEHKRIVEDYRKLDEAKRLLKAQRVEDAVARGEMEPEDAQKSKEEGEGALADEEEEDEDKYADDVDMPGQKFETKQRITVRNLRIREDTAKYLYNLDVNSAYYDPKTRAMRENPFKATGKGADELPYAGDNFVRWTGDAMEMAKQQLFAWEAYEKGSEVNLQADPTKLDMLTREYVKKKDAYKSDAKNSILEKYGGQEHLEAPPKHLLMAQSENYVEYSRQGAVLKGKEKAKVKSRYEEDVYTNNHTSVWGSFWKDGSWGYKCCHSLIQGSYCTGSAGREAEKMSIIGADSGAPLMLENGPGEVSVTGSAVQSTSKAMPPPEASSSAVNDMESSSSSEEESRKERRRRRRKEKKREKRLKRKQKEKEKKKKKKRRSSSSSSSSSSSDSSSSESESEDEQAKRTRKIAEAIRKEEKRLREVDDMMKVDERKRAYNVTYDFKGPTDEDIEAYQMKRKRDEDPMAQFM